MKAVLLKLSGELFKPAPASGGNNTPETTCINIALVKQIIEHIKQLKKTHAFNIVIGGGNFFRGGSQVKQLGITRQTADAVGMLATVMNGLLLRDFFDQAGIAHVVLGPQQFSGIVSCADQTTIAKAQHDGSVIIFVGGTGNPYFSTDTAAVLRALQTGTQTIWKASTIDGVYDDDPAKNPKAKLIKKLTYMQALEHKLAIMDLTALTLAQEHHCNIRVFNIFAPDALLLVAQNDDFGSTIQ